jgi:hypothetical protein
MLLCHVCPLDAAARRGRGEKGELRAAAARARGRAIDGRGLLAPLPAAAPVTQSHRFPPLRAMLLRAPVLVAVLGSAFRDRAATAAATRLGGDDSDAPPPAIVASGVKQPVLAWSGARSDWINVQANDIVGGMAKGDGKTDDSAALTAIMANFSGGESKMVIYFPPGIYPISKTLTANKTIGGQFLGHGSKTTIKWVGAKNGTMFISAGMTKHRYAGLHWDGDGVAGTGVLHQSINEFETEITHEAECFSNFLEVGIAVISAKHAIASAEILYRNTIFENSKIGVLLNNFNDYDDTFDGCVFRNLAFGLYSRAGISYLRNTRFENSSVCDVNVGVFWAFNSVQRVTSVGSRMFVCEAVQWEEFGGPYLPWGPTFVGPGGTKGPDATSWWGPAVGAMTVRDCHVDSWTGPAAINVSGTLQVYDSTFTNPAMAGAVAVTHVAADDAIGRATDRVQNWPIMLSNNTISPSQGPRTNSTSCAELAPPVANATEMMECGGMMYGCDPSCATSDFHCDRNATATGTPCKPPALCPGPHPGANQTACPATGFCPQVRLSLPPPSLSFSLQFSYS